MKFLSSRTTAAMMQISQAKILIWVPMACQLQQSSVLNIPP